MFSTSYKHVLDRYGFLASDFDEPILYAPARTDATGGPCTELVIVTAFTDCDRISTHMIKLSEGMKKNRYANNIHINIILGMTKSSLSKKKHEDICRLLRFLNSSKEMPTITCRYICNGPEVHTKLYIWGKPDSSDISMGMTARKAYCGSLNYTMNAFYKRREVVCTCEAWPAFLYYYNEILPDTIDCYDPSVSEKLKNVINKTQGDAEAADDIEPDYEYYDRQKPVASCKISLLTADGTKTGYGSGVNWGIRPNGTKRDINQAYIPYNVQDRLPGFFPDRQSDKDINCPMFKVITKDFGSFHMRMAQQGNKALQSVESNAILGEWIRKHIGVDGFVTKQMLENYGKTYVTFRKFEDGTYLLDF